ncbi:hypothetical protein AB1Y20_016836 [Prymnesium parvum]|uniref:Uncharacterized protein n=1 Tax=Prymnesium parvum TaxID=97485 RepID=A0AB34ID78_PRYPA
MAEEQWPEFPCEDPTATELADWLRVWDASLKGLEVEAVLRGATPPSLISLSRATDLTDFTELTAVDEPDAAKRLRHNASVKRAHRDEANRVEAYAAGVLRVKNGFAGQLEKALRRTAPARLRRLRASHAVAGVPGAYDSAAMMLALRALVGVHGRSSDADSNRLVFLARLRMHVLRADVWFDYVPSASKGPRVPCVLPDASVLCADWESLVARILDGLTSL